MGIKRFHNFLKNEYDFQNYLLNHNNSFKEVVIQNIDFISFPVDWDTIHFNNTIFMECELSSEDYAKLLQREEVFIYPKIKGLPYLTTRKSLYSWQELLRPIENQKGEKENEDYKIYKHYKNNRFNPSVKEALAQRIHDYSIDNALRELLKFDDKGMTEKKCVGFMGGHTVSRFSDDYYKVALTAKLLAEKDYYIVSGGGPGIMEAANFGAYMAKYSLDDFEKALKILQNISKNSEIKEYKIPEFMNQALKVLDSYPNGNDNLAIPTWFYGHEPSNVFASHIAKYFSNSIREDILLAICLYGVIYAPGSAGTTQEIFQEATQNHYGTYGYYSPMVFMSIKHYVEETSLYSTLHLLAKGQKYKELLFLTDNPQEAIEYIINHPPIKMEEAD